MAGLPKKPKRKLPYYSMLTNGNKFFRSLRQGDVFKYSDLFSFEAIRKRADRRGIVVKNEGGNIVIVVKNRLFDPQPFHFDEKLIDI